MDDVDTLKSQLSFCRDSVQYRACVPAHQPFAAWEPWNASQKDALLARLFKDMVEKRLAKEMNVTPEVYVPLHLLANPACIAALKNVLCWYNFPKCSDENVSLPLCRSSCQMYYTACNFQLARREDGTYENCSADWVEENGLFGSQLTSPDQVLGEVNRTCQSTLDDVEAIQEAVGPASEPFIFSTLGIVVLSCSAAIALSLATYLLVPYGLRVYIIWALQVMVGYPLALWRKVPTLRGKTLLAAFVVTFLALTVVGLWRLFDPNAGFQRFSPAKDLGATWHADRPQVATYEVQTKQSLSQRQLKQLVGSCSCTGASWRPAPRLAGPGLVALAGLLLGPGLASAAAGPGRTRV